MAVYYVASKLSIAACQAGCFRSSRRRHDKMCRQFSSETDNDQQSEDFGEVKTKLLGKKKFLNGCSREWLDLMVMVMDSFEAFRLLCSSICQSSLKIVWQPAKKRVQHFRNPSNMGILWICCYSSHRRERRVSQICIIDSSFSLTWNLHIKIWCNSLSVFPRLSFFDVAFVALKIAPCSFRKIYNNIRKLILSLRPISDASHCCTDIKCCEVFFCSLSHLPFKALD